jgi:hypothetical protein
MEEAVIDGIHIEPGLILLAAVEIVPRDKYPLGVMEAATENTAVVQALLDKLIDRGLDPKVCRLFIVGGAKVFRKAIVRTFGKHTPIQRRQIHKCGNIMDRLPKLLHASVRRACAKAGIWMTCPRLSNRSATWTMERYFGNSTGGVDMGHLLHLFGSRRRAPFNHHPDNRSPCQALPLFAGSVLSVCVTRAARWVIMPGRQQTEGGPSHDARLRAFCSRCDCRSRHPGRYWRACPKVPDADSR